MTDDLEQRAEQLGDKIRELGESMPGEMAKTITDAADALEGDTDEETEEITDDDVEPVPPDPETILLEKVRRRILAFDKADREHERDGFPGEDTPADEKTRWLVDRVAERMKGLRVDEAGNDSATPLDDSDWTDTEELIGEALQDDGSI